MTATLAGRLAYKGILATHRDAMVTNLVETFRQKPQHAELMIDQLWVRLTNRLVTDYAHLGVDQPMAERIMNETLGFLQLCSRSYGHGPSPLVDLGWHTFILYTMEYAAFCNATAGHYLHHAPTDVVGLNAPDSESCGDASHKCANSCSVKCATKCNYKCSSVTPTADASQKCSYKCFNKCNSKCKAGAQAVTEDSQKCANTCSVECANKCNNACSSVAAEVEASFPDGICFASGEDAAQHFTIQDTVEAMKALGPVDLELWTRNI